MKNTFQMANNFINRLQKTVSEPREIAVISSYPPRECGIATYTEDLLAALKNKFNESFSFSVYAIDNKQMNLQYPNEVRKAIDTSDAGDLERLATEINQTENASMVLIQHEFGLFRNHQLFLHFLNSLQKPKTIVFHTVIPFPNEEMKENVQHIIKACNSIIVMTKEAASILENTYDCPSGKLNVIPHGTHLVQHKNRALLKEKYGLTGKTVLSTFGLLSSGKGIEHTIEALPKICMQNPDVIFLLLGKTHPEIVKAHGETYRDSLKAKVAELNLEKHVLFINEYLPLNDLLEYLQITDIYMFSSLDLHQTVSGTFAYAMSCGCSIVSNPIPQAKQALDENTGIIVDFKNKKALAEAVNGLIANPELRQKFRLNTIQKIVPTSWENSAIAHAKVFKQISDEFNILSGKRFLFEDADLSYALPKINLSHIKNMTTGFGMIQFSKMNQPDLSSGYTLDDNARALIALGMYFEKTGDYSIIHYLKIYLDFIAFCQQPEGDFLNYVSVDGEFSDENKDVNLEDANGRAVWALGYIISIKHLLPQEFSSQAQTILQKAKSAIRIFDSPRAIAFCIKGLYFSNIHSRSIETSNLIGILAKRLAAFYHAEARNGWIWFEPYMTYANAVLPEAMLCAWQDQKNDEFRKIAKNSFDFLASLIFKNHQIKVISNKSWLHKGQDSEPFGEQPIDIAYTIIALNRFYKVFGEQQYIEKLKIAFDWFLGNNHLNQIIYNPATGGCFDGLEETQVNLNQGAESVLSYTISRLIIETASVNTAMGVHLLPLKQHLKQKAS
jgi:glycosyltransferase involved in cell wall biosynthesis